MVEEKNDHFIANKLIFLEFVQKRKFLIIMHLVLLLILMFCIFILKPQALNFIIYMKYCLGALIDIISIWLMCNMYKIMIENKWVKNILIFFTLFSFLKWTSFNLMIQFPDIISDICGFNVISDFLTTYVTFGVLSHHKINNWKKFVLFGFLSKYLIMLLSIILLKISNFFMLKHGPNILSLIHLFSNK